MKILKKIILLFILLNQINQTSFAQLRICNYSFEWDGEGNQVHEWFNPPYCWQNCPSNFPPTQNHSTVDLGKYATLYPGIHDSFAIAMVANPKGKNNESFSGYFVCNPLLSGVKYKYTYLIMPLGWIYDTLKTNLPPPLVWMRLGHTYCDTFSQIIVKKLDWRKGVGLELRDTSFIAEDSYGFITIGVNHVFPDTIAENGDWYRLPTGILFDKIGDFIPDTSYNSEHNPFTWNAVNNQACYGSILQMQSPYGNINEQHWYRNNTYLGEGEYMQDTCFVNARYTLVVGHGDTCVRSVLVRDLTITEDCEDIVVPNAISANGDGRNDSWHILNASRLFALAYEIESIQLFNRWGNKVAQGSGLDFSWDAKEQDINTYFYIIKYKNKEGTQKLKKGTIVVLR